MCILSSNVMSMAVEDLKLQLFVPFYFFSGSEAKFVDGQQQQWRDVVLVVCRHFDGCWLSKKTHFRVFLLTAHNRLSHTHT